MKRRIISITIVVSLILSFFPVYAINNSSNITMPVSECELGYIFTTDGLNNANTPDEYRGIAVISEELNIYYAADLEALKNIANKFNVIHWEEDFKILVQNIDSNSISLFSEDDGQTLYEQEGINMLQVSEDDGYLNDPLLERQWYYDAVKARKNAEEKYFGEYSYDNSIKTGGNLKYGISQSSKC